MHWIGIGLQYTKNKRRPQKRFQLLWPNLNTASFSEMKPILFLSCEKIDLFLVEWMGRLFENLEKMRFFQRESLESNKKRRARKPFHIF